VLYAAVIPARVVVRHDTSIGRVALLVSGLLFVCAVAIWHGLRWGWIGAVALVFMRLSWMATAMLISTPDGKVVILDLMMIPLVLARALMEVSLLILLLLRSTRRHFRAAG
jgi:hypothetical protein